MAKWQFKLPEIGEGVTEGEVVAWLVSPGDTLREDQPVVDLMTDKATVTITTPRAGKVLAVHGKVGELVSIHGTIVDLEVEDGAERITGEQPRVAAPPSPLAESSPSPMAPAPSAAEGYWNERPLATPATRKIARERGVDLRRVPPTGPSDRVTLRDVEGYAAGKSAGTSDAAAVAPSVAASVAPGNGGPSVGVSATTGPAVAAPAPAATTWVEEHRAAPNGAAARGPDPARVSRVPFAGMRRKIAQRMAQSKHTAAHFTFVEECDVGKLRALRERLAPLAKARGVKLTYLPFIVKAVVAALVDFPILNSMLDETAAEIVYKRYYHIGIASATDAGLIVPVVRDCDTRSLLGIAREIERLATETKAGTAKPEDLSGSTFTITSLGAQGGLLATPVLNHPEVGILGVHRIKERPVVREGQIVIGEVMNLSLSFDHRIVDGHVGAAFAYAIIGYLENPDSLVLEL